MGVSLTAALWKWELVARDLFDLIVLLNNEEEVSAIPDPNTGQVGPVVEQPVTSGHPVGYDLHDTDPLTTTPKHADMQAFF